jgi:hypothetical protein
MRFNLATPAMSYDCCRRTTPVWMEFATAPVEYLVIDQVKRPNR